MNDNLNVRLVRGDYGPDCIASKFTSNLMKCDGVTKTILIKHFLKSEFGKLIQPFTNSNYSNIQITDSIIDSLDLNIILNDKTSGEILEYILGISVNRVIVETNIQINDLTIISNIRQDIKNIVSTIFYYLK